MSSSREQLAEFAGALDDEGLTDRLTLDGLFAVFFAAIGFDIRDLPGILDLHMMRRGPAAPALHKLDLIFAEKEFDAFGVFANDALFAGEHRGPIDFQIGYLNPEFLGVLQGVVDFGVVEQDLRGDATYMQAGAAEETVLFDDQGFQAPLGSANGCDVSARSAADNRQIVCRQR